MPFLAPRSATKPPSEPCPAGAFPARCIWILDLGSHEEAYKDEPPVDKRKIRIGFELPTETKVFKPELGEQPFLIGKEYTFSFHEKASFRKFLETWRGLKFTDEQAYKFDISTLLGQPAMVSVSHTVKGDRTYANLDAAMKLPKGMTCPPQVGESLILHLDDLGNPDVSATIMKLPPWVREKIEKSREFIRFDRAANPDPAWVSGKDDDSDPAWAALCKDEPKARMAEVDEPPF